MTRWTPRGSNHRQVAHGQVAQVARVGNAPPSTEKLIPLVRSRVREVSAAALHHGLEPFATFDASECVDDELDSGRIERQDVPEQGARAVHRNSRGASDGSRVDGSV